ncbi:MAG TPA: tetratricopeptide repeat protein, partial [Mangrovimonas sp.]|nr:tetratricopeptide repeat protein [Mangrovimonas sp.]
DAYLRLGDAYFASSNYSAAVSAYEKAINIGEMDPDYAYFQIAMSNGFAGNNSKKNQQLEAFIKNQKKSKFRDDALFELGNSYVKVGETSKAIQFYDQLISDYPTSAFVSNAMLRQGLVYYNQGTNSQALGKFKTVAEKYPNTADATQAVATARLIYVDEGRVDEYAAWVRTLDYVEVTDADLDNTTYESAEKQFLENKPEQAIKLFNSYLNQFPKGLHALQAHFYLAQLYFQKGLSETAAPHYEAVANVSQNEFTEEALTRLSQIYLEQKNWTQATPILERLEEEAQIPQNVVFAQSNLMKANYQLNQYNQAVSYAEKVLGNATIDNKIKSDAHVIIARSAIKTGDEAKAKQAYTEVEKVASGELKAEALYYNAYFKNKEGKYEASNATVQKLAKDYSAYKYLSAKGLVVMAKNFYALGDAFQATYILDSVIENFKEFDDVVSEAQQELNTIKTEQAKTNSSVQNQD